MATRSRSQIIMPGDVVQLRAKFTGADGSARNTDSLPEISIVEPSGGVILGPTSEGVYRESTGVYGFKYDVGLHPQIGVWRDVWQGTIDGLTLTDEFVFQVNTTQMPAINSDGYVHLGDDPGFNYSQNATRNINSLLKTVRARLKSRGMVKRKDEFGNEILKDCDIFSTDELVTFIANSLTFFNSIPTFTFFTFEDTAIIEQFHALIAQHAVIYALASQALIERGSEHQISDQGITYNVPTMSELLNSQYGTEFQQYIDAAKQAKRAMVPAPTGLSSYQMFNSPATRVRMLRTMRARRII